jgi:hypothetical protein
MSRLRYILSQGCKEGIVAEPQHWRGAHCVRELLDGITTLHGEWVDRTAMYRAVRQLQPSAMAEFTLSEVLELSPLPCFDGVDDIKRREWIRSCIEEIVAQARLEQRTRGAARRTVRGAAERDVDTAQSLKRSPAPWFHVSSAAAGFELRVLYAEFVALFRDAADRLKRGVSATFPAGSFPPAMPYIPA